MRQVEGIISDCNKKTITSSTNQTPGMIMWSGVISIPNVALWKGCGWKASRKGLHVSHDLIAHYERKEAFTVLEPSLWNARMMENDATNDKNRGIHAHQRPRPREGYRVALPKAYRRIWKHQQTQQSNNRTGGALLQRWLSPKLPPHRAPSRWEHWEVRRSLNGKRAYHLPAANQPKVTRLGPKIASTISGQQTGHRPPPKGDKRRNLKIHKRGGERAIKNGLLDTGGYSTVVAGHARLMYQKNSKDQQQRPPNMPPIARIARDTKVEPKTSAREAGGNTNAPKAQHNHTPVTTRT